MKKLIRLIVVMAIAAIAVMSPMQAKAQMGELVIGGQTGLTTTNNSMVLGCFMQMGLVKDLVLSPEIGVVFRNQHTDALTFDGNLHFLLNIGIKNARLYPLAGINYSAWTVHDVLNPASLEKNTLNYNKVGLNLGAGFQFDASDRLRLKVEGKYVLASKFSTTVFTIGVGYIISK